MAMEQGPQQSVEQFKGQARLPKFAVPRRYDLSFKPDLSACTFTGAVQITVDVIDPTHFLVLNSAELDVRDGSVSFKSHYFDKELRPSEIVLVKEDEILVLKFDEVLPIGTGVLAIGFEGTLTDRMKGFYRSVYEHNGEKKNMAVTQFEPADARRCFPCWDEPACKASFKITLEVPSELVALSNMPVIDEKVDGSLKTLSFQESPIMSTYLVAIVIGLFDYVEGSTTDGIKVRVYCQVGKSNQGKFALDVAVKTLDLYKKYFNVPYPLPKLDMVAIPDFAAGAMENYGLVTYRETALLYDKHHSAAANKQRVATVVAHELAHQWFGNLVTMEWWTHLWLNEGFATWVSYLSADSLFPEWKIWTQFLDETTAGLRLDALAESHPIEVDINHADEIDEIFDAISYRKGASVIRMLQSYLGADVFQKSLALYIKRFAWSNAKTEDLWAALEEVSGEPVNLIMNSWTKQQGYPVVSVKVNGDSLEFEQSQFLSSGLPGDGQWMVPITICFGSYDAQKKFLLRTKTEKLDKLDFSDSSDISPNLVGHGSQSKGIQSWIKVNVDQTGFYRVQYDDLLTAGLRYAIEAKQLSETDRYGILDDSFALCMACKQTMSSLISLMSAYREELNYTVVSQMISMSYKLTNMIAEATPELLNETKLFLINILQFSAENLGWDPKEGESHLDAMLRGEILTALAELGHESTLHEAARRFSAFLDDRNTPLLPPDIRGAAFIAVMQTVTATNKSGYDSLLRVYKETDLSQEKVRILGCLTSCPDAAVVLDVLNFLLTPAVRSQDVVYGLGGISREGRETAWIWLKENWEFISKTWGSGFLLTRFISSIVSPFSSDEKAKEIEAFFRTRVEPSISRTLKQSLERVRNNARWINYIKNDNELGEVVRELAHRKY
ncbi:Peptidase M1 alanine aminopeptidase/leukotriene A4 hydrolase protein [Dioscorea alata]|uniref:Peptidase M1 alanine aminopeptidase/leukotriene A4 hydrolase protein n=1 Tax=Dioscorea alata TaxID=55571 RepID=A0ACB7W2P2_DIOAL|nr:Peptidase M1 alanine aminopeptidase/leukotriene A4 hydrolase protein [Dioscorea alata]